MERIRAVVFDLDGTLADSLADIAAAVNSTLELFGRATHTLDAYRTMVGWGLRQLLVAASASNPFSEKELDLAHQRVVELYHAEPVARTTVYGGIRDLLAELAGIPLAVLTNKEETVARRVVETLFPGVFRAVAGSRADRAPKPHPSALLGLLSDWRVDPRECALLGDSGVDMATATAAGAVPCGALWGYRGEEELTREGASMLFSEPSAFARWLAPRWKPYTVPEGVS